MSLRIHRITPCALTCLAWAAMGPALTAQTIKDNLVTVTNRTIRGVEVTEATSSTIKYTQRGEAVEVPASTIQRIESVSYTHLTLPTIYSV